MNPPMASAGGAPPGTRIPASWLRPDLWLAEKAGSQGDKPAIIFRDQPISYGTLWERVARLAAGFHREGLRSGDRIACISGNHPAFLEAYFASSLLGALFVPLNFRLAAAELVFQIRDSGPSLVLVGTRAPEIVSLLSLDPALRATPWFVIEGSPPAPPCAPYENLLGPAAQGTELLADRPFSPCDPQLIMYTSGTTGVPKGAVLPFRKTLYNSLNAQAFFELSARDTVAVPTPLFHSLGLNILSVPTLFQGGTVLLLEQFAPGETLSALERHRATFMGAVPTIYRRLLAHGLDRQRLEHIRFFFTAGAPIAVDLIEAYHRLGILLKQGFGQTETSILCCLDARDAVRKAGSVGRPVSHGEVKIVDEQMHEVPAGVVGEIVASGPIVMLGYWNRPEETSSRLVSSWLHTQDLAWRDPEGFITLAGRKSDMYISGGENIYPEEVEKVYLAHPDVLEVAVVGVPDPDLGEAGLAFVVLREGAPFLEESLRTFGRNRLAGYKIPRRFVRVGTLPRTETGKVQKFLLRRNLP